MIRIWKQMLPHLFTKQLNLWVDGKIFRCGKKRKALGFEPRRWTMLGFGEYKKNRWNTPQACARELCEVKGGVSERSVIN